MARPRLPSGSSSASNAHFLDREDDFLRPLLAEREHFVGWFVLRLSLDFVELTDQVQDFGASSRMLLFDFDEFSSDVRPAVGEGEFAPALLH